MEPQITHQDKLNALRIKIRQLYTNKEDIDPDELSKKYEIEYITTKNTINEEITDLTTKEPTDDMLTSDQTIKTKETLAFLHKNSKELIEKAISTGNYQTALAAMNTLSKQVELTMKKLGELNPDKKNELELNAPTFLEFLTKNLNKEHGSITKEQNTTKQEEKK